MKPAEAIPAREGAAVRSPKAWESSTEVRSVANPPETFRPSGADALPSGTAGCLVGECIDPRHPALVGRVRVRWPTPEGGTEERWMPTLQGLPVREGDRVLVMQPSNWNEPVITGVLDGFARRPEVPKEEAARLELQRDEAVRVAASDGTPLLEAFQGEQGPVVRLLHDDIDLEMPGALRIKAASIALRAERGATHLEAHDDVIVRGENVHLNP